MRLLVAPRQDALLFGQDACRVEEELHVTSDLGEVVGEGVPEDVE